MAQVTLVRTESTLLLPGHTRECWLVPKHTGEGPRETCLAEEKLLQLVAYLSILELH